jgi:hypothetical protein
MEQIPLQILLEEYVDSLLDPVSDPYKIYLRQQVVIRLENLARRKGRDQFEAHKSSRGKAGKSDTEVVRDALVMKDPTFFSWLCNRDFATADGCSDRVNAWKNAITPEHTRRAGHYFVRYFVTKV